MPTDQRLHEAVEQASQAFWSKVAELYPEAKSGDLDPMSDAFLETAMQQVVKAWIRNNCKG